MSKRVNYGLFSVMTSSPPPFPWLAMRVILYYGAVTAMFQSVVILGGRYGWQNIVTEGHMVEILQLLILVSVSLGFAVLAWLHPETRGVHVICSLLAALAAIRECNNTPTYKMLLNGPVNLWVIGLLLLSGAVFCFRHTLWNGVLHFATRPGFMLCLTGGLVTLAWAQILSQNQIWEHLQDRLLEECLELAGHILILGGFIEEVLHARKHPQVRTPSS
jgi:hypothetical protein